MDEYDQPLSAGAQTQIRELLETGEFVECVYGCQDCDAGDAVLVRKSFVNRIRCDECDSSNITVSVLTT